MLRRHRQQEFVVEQWAADQIIVAHGQREQGGVNITLPELLQEYRGFLLDQDQAKIGQRLFDLGHKAGEDISGKGGKRAQPETAGQRVMAASGDLVDSIHLAQDAPGRACNLLADIGEHHPAIGPFQQRDTQLLLKLFDLPTQRGLTDTALLSGLAKML